MRIRNDAVPSTITCCCWTSFAPTAVRIGSTDVISTPPKPPYTS
jgi:hypothetical protein